MRRLLQEMTVIALSVIALIYLANPTAGVIELIPDNIPFVGNLDEAGAVLILMNTLRYYGIDLAGVWDRDKPKRQEQLTDGQS